MNVNTRGTFLCSKYCIPYLKKAKNPHILTISPPLYMVKEKINWFELAGTGYTLAKYGMTLLTYGMSGELEDSKIGCNCLWPKTTIATAAIKNILGGDVVMKTSRTPEIMADSAYVIMTSKSSLTNGNFFLDDEVLGSVGITDLNKYKCDPNNSEKDLTADYMC